MTTAKRDVRSQVTSSLPDGCRIQRLTTFPDERGAFTEIFRNAWFDSPTPLQWSLSRNTANALRGVHVHAKHWDYVSIIAGRMLLGLHDMRPISATRSQSVFLELSDAEPLVVSIPPGVAHGFYFREAGVNLTASSRYYDPPDHMRCRWDSPELNLDWPCSAPLLSPQDEAAGSYDALAAEFSAAFVAAGRAIEA